MFFVAGATHSEPVTRTVLTGRGVPCRKSWKGKSRSSPGGNSSIGLATLLAVHLIRNASTPWPPARRTYGALPQGKLRAVVEHIEEHLEATLTLEQMAAAAHLSACHFARRFKAATGLPPHQYVLTRRVERAKQLLQTGSDFSLAEVAAHAGFSDQSQFSHHFKRIVGVTPGQFRTRVRTA